jgi:hypothetical protein
VTVQKQSQSSINVDGDTGMISITSAAGAARITGSITFTMTDQTIGTISVDGDFDVVNCK